MEANKKALKGMEVNGTKVTFTKMPAAADTDDGDPVNPPEPNNPEPKKLVTPAGGATQPQSRPKPIAPPTPKGTGGGIRFPRSGNG